MVRRQGKASTPSETAKYHPEYKTRICIDWEDGDCPRGKVCTFAHGQDQLRRYGQDVRLCQAFMHIRGSCVR